MTYWQLRTPRMSAVVNCVGAMFGQWTIDIGGESFSPLARAPWFDDPDKEQLPPILRELQGEWPCVPFGIVKPVATFDDALVSQESTGLDDVINNQMPHGQSSNETWTLESQSDDALVLTIEYPIGQALVKLRREICLDDDTNSVHFKLSMVSDADLMLPIGLHPTFALSQKAKMSELQIKRFSCGTTYPIEFEPTSQFAIGSDFTNLASIPLRKGGTDDARYLPFSEQREELVQLLNVDGEVVLVRNDLGIQTKLKWDSIKLPHCCLWISNRGRDYYPWNSRHLAIGIEPTHSYFDLNPSFAGDKHGLTHLVKDVPFDIEYSISIEKLGNKK